ncbi:MAG: cation:proton antiporter [Thermoanaerobaculia bacterium]
MDFTIPATPAFHIGLAFLLGMVGQVLARHLRVPGIVVLLALGVAMGPDGLAWLLPETLGAALPQLVSFAVAIILFEGALALDLRAVWHQAPAIRRLVTVGAVVTATAAALAVHLILGWEGPLAVLFGALVVVTGPTVIQPILRRIRVLPRVATILEGEAILGDAIGATLAVVALELSVSHAPELLARSGWALAERLTVGLLLGLLAGALVALAVRYERLVPPEARNALAFAIVVGFYQIGDAWRNESGILVAIAAGLLVGNLPGRKERRLHEFKEELTTLLLGLIFVLLAADVRLAEIADLGWKGAAVVALLMFVVRPLDVAISTSGCGLERRERAFLAWLAPRGIVAAAIASHAADVLRHDGISGGAELRALVFLVIAVTVTLQGLSAGPVARALGVAKPPRTGWAILGANGLGLTLAERLARTEEVVMIDVAPERCRQARDSGLRVVEANALEETTFGLDEIEARLRFVGATPNEEVNFIFARRARELLKAQEVWVGLRLDHSAIHPEMVEEIRGHVLFGRERRLGLWASRIETGLVEIETRSAGENAAPPPADAGPGADLLPLVRRRQGVSTPYSDALAPKPGDEVDFAILRSRLAEVRAALDAAGWQRSPEPTA